MATSALRVVLGIVVVPHFSWSEGHVLGHRREVQGIGSKSHKLLTESSIAVLMGSEVCDSGFVIACEDENGDTGD